MIALLNRKALWIKPILVAAKKNLQLSQAPMASCITQYITNALMFLK